MRKFAIVAVAVISIASALAVRAAVIKVGGSESPNPIFVPDSVRVAAGDTVQWYSLDGNHTSTSGTGPLDPEAGDMYDGVFGAGPVNFEFQFNTPGSYSNFCIPHSAFGMKGKIVVTSAVAAHVAANGATINEFDKDSVPILTGGTVEFYWGNGGFHTITSGTGSGDPNAGDLLDSQLDFETPAVQLSFGAPGIYPFFCIPHESEEMNTTVYVSNPCNCPCFGDPECDQTITDVLDVVRAVAVAFRNSPADMDPDCPAERTDVNNDDATDVLDVVLIVGVSFRNASPAVNFVNPCL